MLTRMDTEPAKQLILASSIQSVDAVYDLGACETRLLHVPALLAVGLPHRRMPLRLEGLCPLAVHVRCEVFLHILVLWVRSEDEMLKAFELDGIWLDHEQIFVRDALIVGIVFVVFVGIDKRLNGTLMFGVEIVRVGTEDGAPDASDIFGFFSAK